MNTNERLAGPGLRRLDLLVDKPGETAGRVLPDRIHHAVTLVGACVLDVA
jgi:hypothetical protein